MKKLILSVAAAICSFAAFAGAAQSGMTYVDTKTSIVWKFTGSREYAEPGLWTAAIEGAEMMDGSAVSNNLVIPEKLGEYTVTKINADAFKNNTGITGVTLPATIASIHGNAFNGSTLEKNAIGEDCSKPFIIGDFLITYKGSAQTFTTPAGVKKIAEKAFFNSPNALTDIVLSDEVVLVCQDAFNRGNVFKSITFGKGITDLASQVKMSLLGNYAERIVFKTITEVPSPVVAGGTTLCNFFKNSTKVKEVVLGDSCVEIGANVFSGSSVTNVKFGAKLATIGENAFNKSKLTSISLPDTLTEIPEKAFSGCSALEEVVLPAKLVKIGDEAFSGCSALKEVVLPGSLVKIGDSAFYNCSALEKVTFKDKSALVWIGSQVFAGCTKLGDLAVPDSVEYVGDGFLDKCESLTNLTGGAGIKNLSIDSLGEGLSKLCNHDDTLPFKIIIFGQMVLGFQGQLTNELTTAMLNGATIIANDAFDLSAEWSMARPQSSATPEQRAAASNTVVALKNIDIEVSEIGASAFRYCEGLESVTISGDLTRIGNEAFHYAGDKSGKPLSVTLPETVESVGDSAFYDSAVSAIELPNCRSVGANAFRGCANLTNAVLSGAVGMYACKECTALEQVTFIEDPAGEGNSIGDECFSGCANLASVTLGGVTNLGASAFKGCAKLGLLVDIPETVKTIGEKCFEGCAAIGKVDGGKGLKKVGYQAFSDTYWLEHNDKKYLLLGTTLISYSGIEKDDEVELDEKVTSLAEGAFQYAPMKTVTVPSKVAEIGKHTFGGCSNLTLVIYKNTEIGESGANGTFSVLTVDKQAFQNPKAPTWCTGSALARQVLTIPGYSPAKGTTHGQTWEYETTVNNVVPGRTVYQAYGRAKFYPVTFRTEGFGNDGDFAGNANYQGWLKNSSGLVVGKITVKAAKIDANGRCKVTATVEMAGVKKAITDSFVVKDGKGVAGYTNPKGLNDLQLGANWLTGKIDFNGMTYSLEGGVDAAKDAAPFDVFNGCCWAVAIQPMAVNAYGYTETTAIQVPSIAQGYCGITVSAAAKGKLKIGGFLPDGTKVSTTAQMVLGDNGAACAPIVIQTAKGKKGGFSFLVWFYVDELGNKIMYADKEKAIGNWIVPVDFFTDPYVYIPMNVKACGAVDPTDKCGLAVGLNSFDGVEDFTVTEKGKWEFAKQCKVSFVNKVDDIARRLLEPALYGKAQMIETEDGKEAESVWGSCYNGPLQYFGYLLYDIGTKVKNGVVTPGANTSLYGFKFSYAAKTGLASGSYTDIAPYLDEDKENVSLKKTKHTCNAVVIDQTAYGADVYTDVDKVKYASEFTISKK